MSAVLGKASDGKLVHIDVDRLVVSRGCWEREWKHGGNRWRVAVHAGPGQRKTSTGAEIEPGTFWLECNGFPAGIVALNGWTVAAGTRINEKALRKALEAA